MTPPSAPPSPVDLSFSPTDCCLCQKPGQIIIIWKLCPKTIRIQDLPALKVDLIEPGGDLVGRLEVRLNVHPVVLQRDLAHLVKMTVVMVRTLVTMMAMVMSTMTTMVMMRIVLTVLK